MSTLRATTATNGTGASSVTSAAITTTGATLLTAVVVWYTGATAPFTMSDSKSNTWTQAATTASGTFRTRLYYVNAATPTVGTGHTFTFAAAGGNLFAILDVLAFGLTPTAPLDQNSAAAGSGTTIQPGSITPGEDHEILVTGLGFETGGATPLSINGGFTITGAHTFSSGAHYGGGAAYLIQTGAAAANPTWTITGASTESQTVIASFTSAGMSGAGRLLALQRGRLVQE